MSHQAVSVVCWASSRGMKVWCFFSIGEMESSQRQLAVVIWCTVGCEIMSRAARQARLANKFTDLSVRHTVRKQLFKRGVKSDLIAQLWGAQNDGSLAPYTVASCYQQLGISLMMHHANVPCDAPAVITANPGPQCQQCTLPSIADSPIAIPGPSHVSNQSS